MSTTRPNKAACPCGSGKKYKKCCHNNKPRTTIITFDIGKPVAANEVRVDKGGQVQFLCNGVPIIPEKSRVESFYQRTKGNKIINQSPLVSEHLSANPNRIIEKYDTVYAIDTNTRYLEMGSISVSCVVLCQTNVLDGFTLFKHGVQYGLEFRNILGKSENVAWRKFIELMMCSHDYDPNRKIGLIVDSDLGNLPDYNSRKAAIEGNFYLPANMELIYASADVGKEYIQNQLLARCDKEAKQLINYIISNPRFTQDLQEVKNMPYSHFRFWFIDNV